MPLKFSRNSFLKRSLSLGTLLAIPNLLSHLGANSAEETLFLKTNPFGYAKSKGYTSPLDLILIAATTAPNSHNSQPWKIKKDSETSFLLFGDFDRQLLPIDPFNRQFFHTQGCFLELANMAAHELGYQTKMEIFPQGVPSEKFANKRPMASFRFGSHLNANKDPLFSHIHKRYMNRSKYSGPWITLEESQNIQTVTSARSTSLVFALEPEKVEKISSLLVDAFRTEIQNRERNEINRVYFRIQDDEIYSKADGLTLEAAGLQNPLRWFAKHFFLDLSPEGFHSQSSIEQSVNAFQTGCLSAKGLVFLTTNGKDDERVWLQTGRDFLRLCLAMAGEGISFHTMNQAFVDYPESLPFQAEIRKILGLTPKTTIQLAGRMGRSNYRFNSPRRPLREVLLS